MRLQVGKLMIIAGLMIFIFSSCQKKVRVYNSSWYTLENVILDGANVGQVKNFTFSEETLLLQDPVILEYDIAVCSGGSCTYAPKVCEASITTAGVFGLHTIHVFDYGQSCREK